MSDSGCARQQASSPVACLMVDPADIPGHVPEWLRLKLLTISPARLALMDLVNGAYLHDRGLAPQVTNPLLKPLTLNAVASFPVVQTVDFEFIVELFGCFLYPIALTLQLPLFVFVMVLEKEKRLREMARAMGLRDSANLVTTYVMNFVIYCAVVAFFWLSGIIFQFR